MWKDKSIHLAFINKIERGDKPRYVAVFKASFYDKNKKTFVDMRWDKWMCTEFQVSFGWNLVAESGIDTDFKQILESLNGCGPHIIWKLGDKEDMQFKS